MISQRPFSLLLLLALSALVLLAQTGSGRVQGVVQDTSSAVIAGAQVTITNTATAGKFTTTTNEVGFFVFPPVQPGSYEIRVEAPGMQAWEGKILLIVGQTAEIRPVLKIGTIATEITVAGEVAPLITTTESTISTNLERTRIEQLPMNGRSISNLAMLTTPGMFNGQDGSINPILNGLRDSVEMYYDGAILKNRDTGDFSGRLPGLDSIQELRVETSLSSAKFERPGSIILSTRSGGNQVHGSLFETNRNSAIGVARRRQDNWTNGKAPYYNRNEFGGSVGGPVFLPKLYNGKNRTFFFTTLEYNRIAQTSTTSTSMPTMAMREGDFSGLIDSVGRYTTIYDPWTTGSAPSWQRTPFPNNRIPASRQSSVSKYLNSVTPAPTNNDNPLISNNYFGPGFNRTNDYMWTSRIDHRLSDSDQVFGRFTLTKNVQPYSNGVPATDMSVNTVYNLYKDVNFAANWTHTFSPTFLSESLVTFSRENKFTGAPPSDEGNLATRLKMPNPNDNPFIAMHSYSEGFSLGHYVQQMRQNITNIFVIDQNFTKVAGNHEIKFGGKLHQEYIHVLIDQPTSGSWYSDQFTALFDEASGSAFAKVPQTGHNAASFYLGAVSQYQLTYKRPPYELRDYQYSGYIQDNWKVSSRLTLNFGLRYQNYPAMFEKNYLMASFDKASGSVVLGRTLEDMYKLKATSPTAISQFQNLGVKFITADQAGLPKALVNGNPWLFRPRAGFAYRLGDSQKAFVIRGGYGMFDSQIALRMWNNTQGSLVPFGYPIQYQVNDQRQTGDGLPNWAMRSAPEYPAGTDKSQHVLEDPRYVVISAPVGVEYSDPDQPPSTVHEWNFSIEREIHAGIVASARYVGTHAVNLPQKYNYNAAPGDYVWYIRTGEPVPTGTYASSARNPYNKTTYGSINQFLRTGYSNASAFQFDVQRRYSKGIGFQFIYELTNALTNSRTVGNSSDASIVPATTYLPGVVPDDFDKLNRMLYYSRDTAIPHHQLRWNWVADLPFGNGKPLFGNAGKVLNTVIGGWQLSGMGSYRSRWWSLPTSNWGPRGEVEYYGTKYPIQNCTGGQCIPGYLAWNAYISAPLINRTDANGNCTGICGVPANYQPAEWPLIPYGQTELPPNAPANTNMSQYWDSNNVWIRLNNGTVVRTGYNDNYHPWRNQYMAGPWQFGLDASLFKSFPLTEDVNLRFNADFFNVLNNPGMGTPGSNGIISLQNSNNSPRMLQLSLRLTW
ncbi:MAG: TonB-dependent receptor [Rhodospirillales bacterium]